MYNMCMSKISAPHSSYIESAEKLIQSLRKNENVSKISLGIIKPKKGVSRTVTKPKITLQDTHILIRVNSKLYNQEIRVYGKSLSEIVKTLQADKF